SRKIDTDRRPPCQYWGTVSSRAKRRFRTMGAVMGFDLGSPSLPSWARSGCAGRLVHAKFRSLRASMQDETFTLPAAHALHVADLLAASGTPQEELFAPLGLERAALAVPGAKLEVPVVIKLFERARALSGNPGIGIQLGLQMRASAHGYLGFAAMTASTLR